MILLLPIAILAYCLMWSEFPTVTLYLHLFWLFLILFSIFIQLLPNILFWLYFIFKELLPGLLNSLFFNKKLKNTVLDNTKKNLKKEILGYSLNVINCAHWALQEINENLIEYSQFDSGVKKILKWDIGKNKFKLFFINQKDEILDNIEAANLLEKDWSILTSIFTAGTVNGISLFIFRIKENCKLSDLDKTNETKCIQAYINNQKE